MKILPLSREKIEESVKVIEKSFDKASAISAKYHF